MIKLFTLEQLSASAADAVYKICLSLDTYGFSEEDRQSFEGTDALLTAASFAVEDGDDVIIAVENEGYLALKERLLEKLMLEGVSSPAVAERIAQTRSDEDPAFDLRAHCTVPQGSVTHLTKDGLFSGFTAAVQNGSLSVMPLDFNRQLPFEQCLTGIDTVTLVIRSDLLDPCKEELLERTGRADRK